MATVLSFTSLFRKNPVKSDRWICVFRAQHTVEANLIRGLLESEGIPVDVAGNGLVGAYPGLEWTKIRIYVAPERQVQAKALIEDWDRSHPVEKAWLCRGCGESNAATFEFCWQCSEAPQPASS